MASIARITEVVEPEAKALGFDLVRVKIFGRSEAGDGEERALQIMAERADTGQLVIEDCAALSRRISDRFDALEEAGNADPAAPHLHFAVLATTPERKWYEPTSPINPYPLLVKGQ